ncbi:MAG: YhjD/YihY/BrkB family envelope integrity protein [Evtepia sp.]
MLRLWNAPLIRFFRASFSLYYSKQLPQAAASLAYFLLLTLFPLLICVNAFLSFFNLNSVYFIDSLNLFLPAVTQDALDAYLEYISVNESTGLLIAGIIMTMFSAASAFRILMRGMAAIYDYPPRLSPKRMLASVFFPFALILTVYLSIFVILSGNWLLLLLSQHLPIHASLRVWHWLRFFLLFFIFLLFILLLSHLAAPKDTPHFPLFLGSVFSSCALVAASGLFSFFIGMSTRYSLVYGSLVSLIVLIVWLYLCGNILFLGNVFSVIHYRMHRIPRL